MENSFQLQTLLLLLLVGGHVCCAYTVYLNGKNAQNVQSDYAHLQEQFLPNEGYFYPDNLPLNSVASGVGGALKHQTVVELNPLIAALLLGATLPIPHKSYTANQPLPINPYVALVLSNYGKYLPLPKLARTPGIYGYAAANSYHNYLHGGTYKVTEEK